MEIMSGKHEGRHAEWVAVHAPDYVVALMDRDPQSLSRGRARLCDRFARLIDRFDLLPFTTPCQSAGCTRRATRASVYLRTDNLRWWCNDCDPSSHGASPHKLHILYNYRDAVIYSDEYEDDGVALRALVESMARAKGLPDRAKTEALVRFFA